MQPATERQVPDNGEHQYHHAERPQPNGPQIDPYRPPARHTDRPDGPQHREADESGYREGVVGEGGHEIPVREGVGAAQSAAAGAVETGEPPQRADRVVAGLVGVHGGDIREGPAHGREHPGGQPQSAYRAAWCRIRDRTGLCGIRVRRWDGLAVGIHTPHSARGGPHTRGGAVRPRAAGTAPPRNVQPLAAAGSGVTDAASPVFFAITVS